ncbi:MAG: hypothetical protein ACE366_15045 [Bradymonadia bacterium]
MMKPWLAIACVSLLWGCGDKPKADEKKPAASGGEAAASAAGLTDQEQTALKDELADEAEAAITPENAEQMAEKIEAELNAELK